MSSPRTLRWHTQYDADDGGSVSIECVLHPEDWTSGALAGRATEHEKQRAVEAQARIVVRRRQPPPRGGDRFVYVFPSAEAMRMQRLKVYTPELGKDGMNPLLWGCYLGDEDMVAEALRSGCDVNYTAPYRGYSALHWLADMAATGGNRVAAFELLLQHGVDINMRSNGGKSPLTLAREAGSDEGDRLAAAIEKLGGVE